MNNIIFLLLAFQFLQPTFLGLESITEFIPYATIYMVTWYIPIIFFSTKRSFKNHIKSNALNYLICFLLFTYGVINSVLYNQFTLKSFVLIFSPITCIHIFSFYQQKISLDLKPDNKTFMFAWNAWMIALLFQLVLPSVYTLFSDLFLPRANILVDDRGLSGLATEPSFAAEIMMLFYMVWRLKIPTLKPKENYFFVITLVIAIILNGSATIYGLAVAAGGAEFIVKKIHSFVEVRRLNRAATIDNPAPIRRSKYGIRTVPLIGSLIFLGIILSLSGFQLPPRLASAFSGDNVQYDSFKDFIYKFTLIGMGSWRSLSNYSGVLIGMNNSMFGKGLGSGDIAIPDFIFDKFGDYDNTLHTWITTSFTFFPFTLSDLGVVFCGMLIYYVCSTTRIMLLLRDYPLKGAMVITGLVCVLIISPKSSLTPWFIMMYAADEVNNVIPIEERFEENVVISSLKNSQLVIRASKLFTATKSAIVKTALKVRKSPSRKSEPRQPTEKIEDKGIRELQESLDELFKSKK